MYIPEDTTLTTKDEVCIRGDVYVFGKLKNKDDLDIRGTLHCLSFTTDDPGSNSDTSADRGIVIDEGSISYTSLDTKGGYLSMDMPAAHSHRYTNENEKATCSDDGRIYEFCELCGYVKTDRTICRASRISISKKAFTWTGSRKTPSVTVKDSNGKTLKKNTDYKVTYSKNKNVGKATVKVTLKGNYYGSKTMSFKINP